MDKLKMQSLNKVDDNIEKIGKMFPNCVTEVVRDDKVELGIDFDKLKQELSSVVIEGNEERYDFTWPYKRKSILLANSPINKTLRPCREESVDFDNTKNLYIEGDNLDVLKLLQNNYLGQVKMIYIDPPYNTGNDFVYEDDFSMDNSQFSILNGGYDDDGNRLFLNSDSNGRFHTDWLNMIYPRLKVAKDLLTDDGVIFISIDDNEVENLKKVCNEIFGANAVECYIWGLKDATESTFTKTASNTVRKIHEYIIACYKSSLDKKLGRYLEYRYKDKAGFGNSDNDIRGNWMSANISRNGIKTTTGSKYYTITTPTGNTYTRNWTLSESEFEEKVLDNRIYFSDNGNGVPRLKLFQNEPIMSIQDSIFNDVKTSISGKNTLLELFDEVVFPFVKPIQLLIRLMQIATNKDSLILDFFSGSATTAHAVMQLNAEDGGNRKFICVQLPEQTDEKSEAFKAGYKNICEIGKERIRRAGKQILSKMTNDKGKMTNKDKEQATFFDTSNNNCQLSSVNCHLPNAKPHLDTGFRVLKLDSSNMVDSYYLPQDTAQDMLAGLEDNVKTDRTAEDLLFQAMLEMDITLDMPIKSEQVAGQTLFVVGSNSVVACFEKTVTDDTIKAICQHSPAYAIFRDSSFESDDSKINCYQYFKRLSPTTIIKVV